MIRSRLPDIDKVTELLRMKYGWRRGERGWINKHTRVSPEAKLTSKTTMILARSRVPLYMVRWRRR